MKIKMQNKMTLDEAEKFKEYIDNFFMTDFHMHLDGTFIYFSDN